MTSSCVPDGIVADNGAKTTVPDCACVMFKLLAPNKVSVPSGKLPPLLAYKRTVTGWVWLADSTPKETEFTVDELPPGIANARQ